jgi:hypothetical protein
MGHWTFECTGQKVYLYRPSRTQVAKNPALANQEMMFEAGPEQRPAHDGDYKRSTLEKHRNPRGKSSSSSSSSDSEAENLQAELEKLLNEHKKLQTKKQTTKGKKASASSSEKSSSSDSSSN